MIRRTLMLGLFGAPLLVSRQAVAGAYEDYFAAISRDDVGALRGLLERGMDPNTRNPAGFAGLFLAIRDGSLRCADLLVSWPRIDVDPRTAQDETPLMMAALKGHLGLVERLIKAGADVNKTGWTPLHYAATAGNVAIVRVLLEQHAYIDAESPNGTTPLMMAARYGSPGAVKVLLEEGADPMLKNQLHLSAIDFALGAERRDSAELIGAFVRARQPKGKW
jgi:ankyrin repeat protein